jgi:hypothetical protein
LLHNALLVEAETKTFIGLAGQTIHCRKPAPKKENRSQGLKRERESRVWGDVADQISPPPEGAKFIHVFYRGANDVEIFCHLRENRDDWVVHARSLHRLFQTPTGKHVPLDECLPQLPVAGIYELRLRARPGQSARTSKL